MMSSYRFNSSRSAQQIEKEAERKEKRIALASRERKQLFLAAAVFVIIVAAASFHAHRVLAARTPADMPINSTWILTGHNRDNNDKLGLWIGCWKKTAAPVDHCRIADERGALQYDGDMLPLAIHPAVVEDKDLNFAKLDPEDLWVRGVNYDLPVPVLPLADGTQLVPISDREGLRRRLDDGDWLDGLEPAPLAAAR
jgi:hypothetical protein